MLLFTVNLHTKFEMSCFIHSKDMTGPQNVEMGHDPDHALSEMIYHWQSATYYGQHTHTHTMYEI